MKLFTVLFFATFITNSIIAQDSIANPGFEHWTFHGSYYNPDPWTTLNPLTSLIGAITAIQDSTPAEVHSGKYSLKLVTKIAGPDIAPGLVTTGVVNTSTGNIDGGIAINSRPSTLSGWFLYTSVGHDSGSMQIKLTKWNTTGDSTDLVGFGIFYAGATVSSWTQFTVPVNYTSGAMPDTVQILCFSSNSDTARLGSTLILDDLSYSFVSGISDNQILPLNIYPNPAHKMITVENSDAQARVLNIYAMNGKLVNTVALHEGNNKINISGMSAGLYLLNAAGNNGITYQTRLSVE